MLGPLKNAALYWALFLFGEPIGARHDSTKMGIWRSLSIIREQQIKLPTPHLRLLVELLLWLMKGKSRAQIYVSFTSEHGVRQTAF